MEDVLRRMSALCGTYRLFGKARFVFVYTIAAKSSFWRIDELFLNVFEGLSAKNVKSQKVICNFYMFDKG